MHITTKEVDKNGVHILTSVLESDGAGELASTNAKITAQVISVQRTVSGGIQVQCAVEVKEPALAVTQEPTPKEQAVAYFLEKGFPAGTATDQVERFGVDRVLAMRNKELAEKDKALDAELEQLVAPKKDEPAPKKASTPAPDDQTEPPKGSVQ